jgi:hypothetical protein
MWGNNGDRGNVIHGGDVPESPAQPANAGCRTVHGLSPRSERFLAGCCREGGTFGKPAKGKFCRPLCLSPPASVLPTHLPGGLYSVARPATTAHTGANTGCSETAIVWMRPIFVSMAALERSLSAGSRPRSGSTASCLSVSSGTPNGTAVDSQGRGMRLKSGVF